MQSQSSCDLRHQRAATIRLGIVVNSEGLQERRAAAIAERLPKRWRTTTSIGPSPRQAMTLARESDVVYVIDPGKRGFPASIVSRGATRTPTIVEIGDPQATLYSALGRGNAAVALGGVLDRVTVTTASQLVFRGRELAQTLAPRRPWTYIPDGVDTERFSLRDARATRAKLRLEPDALVVGVVGSIVWAAEADWAYGLDIIEALPRVPSSVHALIVGDGDGLERLRERAATLGVGDRVILTGRRPHTEIPELLSAMDICVSTQSDDPVGRGRTTAKLPEYLACDRYVLATDVGTANDVLPAAMLLPAAPAGDSAHVARLAQRISELAPHVSALHAAAGTRSLAMASFGYDTIVSSLEAVFLDALRTP